MVRAGEAGGSLHETLARLADYLERSRALQGRVINALIYPAILLVMVGLSLLFLLGYVVPQFAQMYESLDAELPLSTQLVLGVGLFVRDWRSEEHTSELQSLMRISYAVFCLKKNNNTMNQK